MFWTDASTRDKAPWRKSAINAPESDDSSRRLRRMRSRVQTDDNAANEPAKPVEVFMIFRPFGKVEHLITGVALPEMSRPYPPTQ